MEKTICLEKILNEIKVKHTDSLTKKQIDKVIGKAWDSFAFWDADLCASIENNYETGYFKSPPESAYQDIKERLTPLVEKYCDKEIYLGIAIRNLAFSPGSIGEKYLKKAGLDEKSEMLIRAEAGARSWASSYYDFCKSHPHGTFNSRDDLNLRLIESKREKAEEYYKSAGLPPNEIGKRINKHKKAYFKN